MNLIEEVDVRPLSDAGLLHRLPQIFRLYKLPSLVHGIPLQENDNLIGIVDVAKESSAL